MHKPLDTITEMIGKIKDYETRQCMCCVYFGMNNSCNLDEHRDRAELVESSGCGLFLREPT
jgi:hypothetical protein